MQPGFLVEELSSAPEIVKADPRWQEAMKRRGFTDLSRVHVDGWAPGTVGLTTAEGPRLIRALSFDRTNATSSVYSRPIEGLDIVVDMSQRKVVEFVDRGVVPISKDAAQLEAKNAGVLRDCAQAAQDHPAERRGLSDTRKRDPLAEVALSLRASTRAKGSSCIR